MGLAQRCARLTSLRRACEHAGSYDAGGFLPAQAVKQANQVLADARATLDRPMDNLEELSGHVLEADGHYRAWKALQELAGRSDDFADLAAADAADAQSRWGEPLHTGPRHRCSTRSIPCRNRFLR
ncbi:hypothetical protein ACWGKK_14725 [Streptomyces chartreusis]